tara:strand:- start:2816 stop:3574 length:759 start_codon:yes stop_codon:yes gene_type:complete
MSVKIENISFEINNKKILNNISFEIQKGEILAFLGPNGSGKSTIIDILSGTKKKNKGKIFFDNTEIEKINIKTQALIRSTMAQSQQIFYDFSVKEIIELGWIQYEYKNFQDSLTKVSEECGISNLLEKNFNNLSGGEQQRIHFARTLIQLYNNYKDNNRYFFLDEPTANLDITHEINLIEIIKKKSKEGFGVLIALHDLNLAYNFSDRIALIKDGEIKYIGKPNEVLTETRLQEIYNTPISINKKNRFIKYY